MNAIVCVTNDLATDQRVRKTCLTLQKCGYKVLETGRLLPDSLPFAPPYSIRRKKHWFNKGALFYAEYNIRLFLFLLLAKVDLIYSNDLDTLLACYLASKIRNKQLIYDTHEYFTEVPELIHRPKIQRIWKRIENWIFPKLTKIITVNQSIADIYQKEYGKKVTVVRNIPNYTDTTTSEQKNDKIIIYQGALNKGRTLELAIDTMPLLPNYQLHIYGKGDIEKELKERVKKLNLTDKILFFGQVEPTLLKEKTRNATVGWCIMENLGLNYYYSLPNRIFDYLHAGVPVIANDFPEMKRIVESENIGVTISKLSPKEVAKKITELENKNISKKDFQSVAKKYCWEKEEQELIKVIKM